MSAGNRRGDLACSGDVDSWVRRGATVGTLRLLEAASPGEKHDGEVFACSYSPDGAFVLSGGWDGQLRLWETSTAAPLVSLQASPKPLSACAYSPDGSRWLSGSMEGLLTLWDAVSHQTVSSFLAHTRPVSAIAFSPDGQFLATASWDRHMAIRRANRDRDVRSLNGHLDIVAGCKFTIDGKHLLSWSHDRTLRLWDIEHGNEVHSFTGHGDRVTCGAVSPDGRWALSGSRDATVRLWDLETCTETAVVQIGAEVRACFFLLDAEAVVVVDAAGRLFIMGVPEFEVQAELLTGLKYLCAELAPSGMQMALGCEDGSLRLIAIEGREHASLVVTATQSIKPTPSLIGRLLGNSVTRMYQFTCPVCRQITESTKLPTRTVSCSRCRQALRVNQSVQRMLSC
jgi:WD domain, G-beta repeat